MNQQLKNKIKESMMNHLIPKGWPNISRNQIVAELSNMWKKLESEGLLTTLPQGFGYKTFVDIALQQKQICETIEQMKVNFGFRRR